ncbi:glycosyl hydrolase [Chryseolinea sp. T2]|uniref:glycosyl hydrolase n=1 Tax=Chryseolinea sp. T2 TaxID=3129255 RepID=UPI003076B3A6
MLKILNRLTASNVKSILICALICIAGILNNAHAQNTPNTTRPWTYWWWMGNAVDSVNIQRQLLQFSEAGFGGVHIIPIYGVKGYESRFKSFLSDDWLNMLNYTTGQAQQLGLGVDLTMGTGWPFGGKHVTPRYAAKKFVLNGSVISSVATGQQVKRAAPGGEGLVVDYYDSAAVVNYFKPFEVLTSVEYQVRALYHDSFEAYGANWSADFLAQFKQRRGYALEEQTTALTDSLSGQKGMLVRMDYQQTLSELLHDKFTILWTGWSKAHHYRTRNQAHGSPGNLLDLYALADIPETESFGSSRFPIPNLRVDDHYEVERFGTPDVLAMKFASSAANLTGKKLVSSETGTWLADHFKVSLSQLKPQIDQLFTAGVNHIFYHGTTYTPEEEGFPGWLFYASTNFGTQSHLWSHMTELNGWVTRCQSRLQEGSSDNDILLYFPIHDIWAKTPAGNNPVQLLDVHHTEKWLQNSSFGKVANQLMNAGHTFDYISDSLLMGINAKRGMAWSGKQSYKVIIVPPVEYMPLRTLQRLDELARSGVSILYVEHTPAHPSGLKTSFKAFAAENKAGGNAGRVVKTSMLLQQIERFGAKREGFPELGLSFIRRRTSNGVTYFVANLSDKFSKGWVHVSESAKDFHLYDPMINAARPAPSRRQSNGALVHIELAPGESIFLIPHAGIKQTELKEWKSSDIKGEWQFSFEKGLPPISFATRLKELPSWTSLSDSAQYFYGAANYQLDFRRTPEMSSATEFILDLGDVREVAVVRVNGQPIGKAWSLPYRLRIPSSLLQEKNSLEIVVYNLSANYMRWYDREHPEWKKFYDINIVDIQYKPYSAADMPAMPSGLMGPVRMLFR